ncbi:hypothetical protein H1N92_gp37 [Escherichia phage aaroes]|uniref:Lipoprotein n=1 Tax=Escherichia phage aaroes TaxID=2696376 RepID=A0A6B9WM12_9CAUD|nr:hypothetical protein H1N92_gp37 [Escherichia phage aaroes]QHR65752.1 hypothetical protein aaroes_37 [Escherichia phage aaroes]
MKKYAIITLALIIGCALAYSCDGILESIGGMIIFAAGCYAGYHDGFTAGKRHILTGKTK